MATLTNKIDFAVIMTVKHANPNGDPLNGNRPRVNYDGFGELSDVCIKRKIRNRLMDMGKDVFVQSDDNRKDDYRSLRNRAEGVLNKVDMGNDKQYREAACNQWVDVRSFGQVFAYKAGTKKPKKGKETADTEDEKGDSAGVSIGIRGPVSIHPAFSVAPVLDRTSSIQITKKRKWRRRWSEEGFRHNGNEASGQSWSLCVLWKHEPATCHKDSVQQR